MKLTTHLHPVLRSGMHGAIPPLQYILRAWCLVKHRDFTLISKGIYEIQPFKI